MKIDTFKTKLLRRRRIYKKEKRNIKLATFERRRKQRKNKKQEKENWWDITIPAPERFGIFHEESRNKVLNFLNKVSIEAQVPNRVIRLDFSKTFTIDSAGGILLRANLCEIQASLSSHTTIKCSPSSYHKINEVLTQIEVLKLFNQDFNISPDAEDVIHWKVAQGSMVEGEHYETVLSHYDGSLSDSLKKGLYKGITEAMTNTKHHAYENNNRELPQWWLFSQEKDNRLYVVFFDLGIGIPRSIKSNQSKIKAVLSHLKREASDADIISTAIKLGETSTGLGWRGKGLRKLKNSVMSVENSNMCIYSSKGMYYLNSGSETPELKNFEQSIGGTLIYWSVPKPK